jgi:hypothetical protein
MSRRVERRRFNVAIGADLRGRTLTREELSSMTIQARGMFGKFGHVRKSCIALADVLPVFCRHLVTGVAREFFFADVSGVRKV